MINLKQHEEFSFPLTISENFRLKKIQEKKENTLFEVAFCGHFSAGKSTILNTLLHAEVLPTSPIPTSANIIKIANGELGLTINTNEENKQWYGEIPWDKVREWGMDGSEVSSISIKAPLPFLHDNSCILDTPGVDSTDPTHKAMTMEQLYTTDVIVYCMDYNHVQSETNLYFLQQLSNENKPIFIIINQVDKHNESEIPFSEFKSSVKEVLQQWDIDYIKLYYTSMKERSHPLNEFDAFEKNIKGLLYNSNHLISDAKHRLEKGFLKSIQSRLIEEKDEEIEEIKLQLHKEGFTLAQLKEREELLHKQEKVINYREHLRSDFENDLGKLFKNVTLFPYVTTEYTRQWLESIQPGFKVGLLFSKKKTAEEQEKRLQALVTDLQEKVKTQLIFHIHDYFNKVDREMLSNKDMFDSKLSKLSYEVSEKLLVEQAKTGYTDRNYVFTFTNEVTSLIISDVKRKSLELHQVHIDGMAPQMEIEEKRLENELVLLNKLTKYLNKLNDIETKFQLLLNELDKSLAKFPQDTNYNRLILESLSKSYEDISNSFAHVLNIKDGVIDDDEIYTINESEIVFDEEQALSRLKKLKDVLDKYKAKKVLSEERNQLSEKIDKYEQQSFVISLFGAFSAGKSSFANALIGEDILPVSPNPTTATVNMVTHPQKNYPNGTVEVKVKSKQMLEKELDSIGQQLDIKLTVDNLRKWKPRQGKYLSSWQRTYIDYVSTLKSSIAGTKWSLGSTFTVNINEIQNIVAKESNACLIEKVVIYYDCPITAKGITIVDTPGVNSIHGRHTNVAFEQMRQSDAIFYLTYYNHAFSKADQHFLQQISKVNMSFSYDKLYFLINAADLAGSERELNGVRKHVFHQLVQNGVKTPRLFDLSSKEGLKQKRQNSNIMTSFAKFEKYFYDETIVQLKLLSKNTIEADLSNYTKKVEESLRFSNDELDQQKEKYILQKEKVEEQVKVVQEASYHFLEDKLQQELDQLLLYLKDRSKLVLSDNFLTAINVAVLTENSKSALQKQLINAVREWRSLGEYFIQQELEATLIRVEQKIKQVVEKELMVKKAEIQKHLPYLSYSPNVEIDPIKQTVDVRMIIDLSSYGDYLKSKRDFFEGGKMKTLKEKLVSDGTSQVNKLLEKVSEKMKYEIKNRLTALERKTKEELILSMHYELEHMEALFDKAEYNSLEHELEELKGV
ncbi:dynamin family protein [Evansella cellulosilytica]|uniref:Dynamin family protein n=1 Tax=Evansella cellulosilytica (strain ATCC 21833 / DSM 2522 / FERM P-1141 / JCM 9156 / N-4) TaxID=649639 RepID=E6U0Y1_EVAC2|nr:dynamin family protein [Evansella cellulosilytica]ADU30293.1 Dynamin family protein [Evansella cellulosilytica DSM 2522]